MRTAMMAITTSNSISVKTAIESSTTRGRLHGKAAPILAMKSMGAVRGPKDGTGLLGIKFGWKDGSVWESFSGER